MHPQRNRKRSLYSRNRTGQRGLPMTSRPSPGFLPASHSRRPHLPQRSLRRKRASFTPFPGYRASKPSLSLLFSLPFLSPLIPDPLAKPPLSSSPFKTGPGSSQFHPLGLPSASGVPSRLTGLSTHLPTPASDPAPHGPARAAAAIPRNARPGVL